MIGSRRWRRILAGIPPWLGLALIILVLVTLSLSAADSPEVQDLRGSWRVLSPVERSGTTIALPGTFVSQGFPADSRLVVERAVSMRDGPQTLWIGNPMFATRVLWDGVELTRSGDPDHDGRAFRSAASLFVPLPEAPADSVHRIVLDIRGDYGQGGVAGPIYVGPAETIQRAAQTLEGGRLATALCLCFLALVCLAPAARSGSKRAHLFLGYLMLVLAVWTYAQSSYAHNLLPHALETLRLQCAATGPIAPLLIAFLTSFLYGEPRRAEQYFLVAGFTLALLALVIPAEGLYAVSVACSVALAAGALWYPALLWRAVQRRERAHLWFLLITLIPIAVGAVSEWTLAAGSREGESTVLICILWLVGGLVVAVVLRDAKAAERHARLVEASIDAMVCLGLNEQLLDINPAAGRLLGWDATGRNFLEWVEPEDRPLALAHIARANLEYDRAEFRLNIRGGLVVESLASPMHAQRILLVLRDVTQRRIIDQGMLHAARMETVGILLGGIAHDFNNMLGNLLAHVGLLQASLDDEAALHRLGRMESNIARASQLTRRLLTVARGTGADLGPVDLGSVCQEALELVRPTLSKRVAIEVDVPEELPPAHGSANDLEQVIVNLLMNARDALDGRGKIRLVARQFDLGNRGRGVAVMVEDDGMGVPEDMRSEIFRPFVTTKSQGTGLGLAVASQILQDHYGRLWYEEGPETGSRFLLALRHADTVHEAPAPLPNGRHVVLVDDEKVLLEDYANALSVAGYEVTSFSNPLQAAAYLESNMPDIMVTDVVMDGLNGLILATRCQARYPNLPILVVSGFVPEIDIPELENGTWHLLHKPVRAARLVSVVGRLRRRAERASRGELDITRVSYLFPPLSDLSSSLLGMHRPPDALKRAGM